MLKYIFITIEIILIIWSFLYKSRIKENITNPNQPLIIKNGITPFPKPDEYNLRILKMENSPNDNNPFTMRIEVPKNYYIPVHNHPENEMLTIIDGTFYMNLNPNNGNNDIIELKQGDFIYIPKDLYHYAFTKDTKVILQSHGRGPFIRNFYNDHTNDHVNNNKTNKNQ